MKYKGTIIRSAAIASIAVLSILIGFAYQAIWHRIDLKEYPREFSEFVEKYSKEYGVSEDVIYAVIKYKSNFVSNSVRDDGGIGLMGIRPSDFEWLLSLTKEDLTNGILYDPETNVRYGAYMISYLYNVYGKWTSVYAALLSDKETVDSWMADDKNLDKDGYLIKIPDEDVSSKVDNLAEISNKYRKLYYSEE